MRKTASILLLGLLVFNWVGYRLCIAVMEHNAEQVLIENLDNNRYDEKDLVSIKVAAPHLAYYETATDFVRIDGHIEMNGIHYNYVKRRLVHDSLEFLCIPNFTAMQLRTAKNDFFRMVNDLQQNGHQRSDQHHKAFKLLNEKYCPPSNEYVSSLQQAARPGRSGRYSFLIPSVCISVAGQPPDAA